MNRVSLACVAALFFSTSVSQSAINLRLLQPDESSTTTREIIHVRGRTDIPSSVTVNGVEAVTFTSGAYVRDNVPLAEGDNEIVVVARAGNEEETTRVTLVRVKREETARVRPTDRLFIERRSVVPSDHTALQPGDVLDVAFEGTPGQRAEFQFASGKRVAMTEQADPASTEPTGIYRASVVLTAPETSAPLTVRLRTQVRGQRLTGPRTLEMQTSGSVEVWDPAVLRIGRVKEDFAALTYGLHEVRLGGPFLSELSSGTLLRLTGIKNRNYHVQLTPGLDAWVPVTDVEMTSPGTSMPHLSFTSVSVDGNEYCDTITIPYPTRVPFSIDPTFGPEGKAELHIDLYGAHNATTWITHKPGARVVHQVTTEQIATDHVRVRARLNFKQLWGYKFELTTSSLRVLVRRPPVLSPPPESPLKGLHFAVEAGHGGRESGAMGVSGAAEKDINRATADLLAETLRSRGAEVIRIRANDETVSHPLRVEIVRQADPDIFISIHANAGGSGGYLTGPSGTSTYYKYSFSRDLSDAIYRRLLEQLDIGDFGNVGNFNYHPLRKHTWMPGMLVEQAFMSNPYDEAKMLDPAFRQQMVNAIVQGVEDFLNDARE